MTSPDTSLNTSHSSADKLKLIIKSANQKYEDFVINDFELDWSIKQLKQYLYDNYPQKPETSSVRLIYSGKMLHDHWTLNECIRYNSEIKSHIIHLVHSPSTNKQDVTQSSNSPPAQSLIENELTPDTSSVSSSSTSSSSFSSSISTPVATSSNFTNQSFSQIQRDLNNLYQQQTQAQQNLTPKQQYEQIHSKYLQYYESMGVSVQENAWYSSYIQQLALYNHMYLNYIQSQSAQFGIQLNQVPNISNQSFSELQSSLNNPSNPISQEQPRPINNPVENQEQAQEPEQQPQQAQPRPAQAQMDGEREDDWLSLLHNAVSFLVLFSIIYYYSSIERFVLIFSIVIVLVIYHNGWLTIQRRQVNPRPAENQPEQNNNENQEEGQNNEANTTNEQERQEQESNTPNTFRLFISFVFTFFTSLIPERPRIAAN